MGVKIRCSLFPWTGGYSMPMVRGIRRARVGRAGFLLLGTLGRYGIKSDARVILWANSGITSDAITGAARMTAYDGKSAVMILVG